MKEIFVSEWLYKPVRGHKDEENKRGVLRVRIKHELEPFQLYLVKLFKVVASNKEDYNELMSVMRNVRPADRKLIMKYIKKFLPGGIKN